MGLIIGSTTAAVAAMIRMMTMMTMLLIATSDCAGVALRRYTIAFVTLFNLSGWSILHNPLS